MEPSKWLRGRINNYANLSVIERKAIRDFAVLWSLFEADWLNTNANIQNIVETVNNRVRNEDPLSKLEHPYAYFNNRYFPDGVVSQYYSHLDIPQKWTGLVRHGLQAPVCQNNQKAVMAMLIIIYRLRNNFFHGTKWAYGFQGQLQNFKHANGVLMICMERW